MNDKYLLNKFSTKTMYDVKESTDILNKFGISHNEKKTRELILKGKLSAKNKNKNNENDRRSGYEISEKALYDLVVNEIPIMKVIFDELSNTGQAKKVKGPKSVSTKNKIVQDEK